MTNNCKSLRIKVRQQKNHKLKNRYRRWAKPVGFKVDINDPHQLILRNGTRIRQILDNVDLYLSEEGRVYSLTRFGLRRRRVDVCKKKRYGLKSQNGVSNGQTYPFVTFRGRTFRVHTYVALAWIGPRPDGHEIDHLNGNIDDWRRCNLSYVTIEENRRRAVILRRLRKAARKYNLPQMNPANRTPEDMLSLFEHFKNRPIKEAMAEEIERQKRLHALR